jgi:hypothetical protein
MHLRRGLRLLSVCLFGLAWGCAADGGDGSPGASGLLVSDDFETATVGGAPSAATWALRVFGQQGSISIDGTQAHSGSKSVYVNGTGQGSYRSVLFTTTAPFPVANNSFYTRAFIRSKNGMGEGHSTYFGAGSGDDQRMVRIGFHQYVLEANLIHPGTEYEVLSGPWGQPAQGVQFVPGKWHCVEAFFDGAQHELRAWFDGTEVARLHTTNWNANLKSWSPQYARAWFGFETYHGEQDELWYDDVAIGTERLGCGE